MYNIRFYLNDDDKVIKCDCSKITDRKDFNLNTYEEIILSKKDLQEVFKLLAKKDLNHKDRIYKNYILHEFTVPGNFIRQLESKMDEYKDELEQRRNERKNNNKFNNKKGNNYVLKRKNKYKRKKIITNLATLLTLSAIVIGGAKIIDNYGTERALTMPAIERSVDEQKGIAREIDEIIDTIQDGKEIIPENATEVKETNLEFDEENYDYELNVETEDLTETEKYKNCYDNYYPIIKKYADMYGVDPDLAVAIATQERGVHSDQIDAGGAIGLFQIQVSVWDGEEARAYNFNTNQWETVVVHLDDLKDVEYNTKIGMMYLQECLYRNDFNLAMAIQEYNFGHGGVMKAINEASKVLGTTVEELETNGNNDWLPYRYAFRNKKDQQMGDKRYLENVTRYIQNEKILRFLKPNYENVNIKFNNLTFKNNLSL